MTKPKENTKRLNPSGFLAFHLVALSWLNCCGQNPICTDAVKTHLYTSSSQVFQSNPIFYSIPTIDDGMVSMQNSQLGDSIAVFKINKDGQPAWAKKIKQYPNQTWQNIQELSNGYLMLTSTPTCMDCKNNLRLFLDNNGSFFYQLVYSGSKNDNGWQICNTGENQSIVFAGTRLASQGGGIFVERADTTSAPSFITIVQWRNSFATMGSPSFSYTLSNLYVVGDFVYLGGIYNDSQSATGEAGIWILKLDYNSGNLLSQKTYRLTSNGSSDQISILSSAPLAKSYANLFTFTVQLYYPSSSSREIGYIQLDENFHISNPPIAVRPINLDGTNAQPFLNRSGTALYYLPLWKGLSYYAYIDSTNTVTKKQFHVTQMANSSLLFQYNLKNNNAVNITMATGLNGQNYLQMTDINPGFILNNDCIKDTHEIFASSRYLPIMETNLGWHDLLTNDNGVLALPTANPTNSFILTDQLECQQLSICSNLKLSGNNHFCLNDTSYIFTATKNSECLKSVHWDWDDSFVSAIHFDSDSSVSLQFKKDGSFYLRGSLVGCGITDSILIHINPQPSAISIGKDTVLCPKTTDTLQSKIPYQKYLWQDGSTKPFFIVTQPGTYFVTATDICNKPSSATVKISYDSSQLLAYRDIKLCKGQEISLMANSGFSGYEWQPASSILGNLLSQSINIRPEETMQYIVNAKSLSGCMFSDTVQAVVVNCLNKLLMPNAFTPNKDGINDLFKPIFYGILQQYELNIYNRWGQQIFCTSKPNDGWDGTKNGALQNGGSYIWVCKYRFLGENEKIEKGSLVLIR